MSDFELDPSSGLGMPITLAGDIKLVTDQRELVRQRLLRRLITDTGEWVTVERYGAGLVRSVREQMTDGKIQSVKTSIIAQAVADVDVSAVDGVEVFASENRLDIVLRYRLKIDKKPQTLRLAVT